MEKFTQDIHDYNIGKILKVLSVDLQDNETFQKSVDQLVTFH